MATTMFLFAHQDDEIGVFAEIERVVRAGERAICVYLTDGAVPGVASATRNSESTGVLARLGVPARDIAFLGEAAGIGDGQLHRHLDAAYERLTDLAAAWGPVHRLVMHGWEGGHQDHDAVHVLGVALARKLDIVGACRQFPLYRAPLTGPLPYTMLRPLPANGGVEATPVSLSARIRYLGQCLTYRSQAKTFLGLLPFIVADYVLNGRQVLQPVSWQRLREPPHRGVPLFERWGRLTWAEFRAAVDHFMDRQGGPD